MRTRKPKLLDLEGLLTFAGNSLSVRAQSLNEVRTKLRLRALNAEDVDTAISRLKEAGFLNDQRFAESFAGWRRDNQGLGKARVARDLMTRRVAPELALKTVEAAYAGADETTMVEEFLARKYRGKDLGALLQEEKNLASAYRRLRTAGFSSGSSIGVLKRYAAAAEMIEEGD